MADQLNLQELREMLAKAWTGCGDIRAILEVVPALIALAEEAVALRAQARCSLCLLIGDHTTEEHERIALSMDQQTERFRARMAQSEWAGKLLAALEPCLAVYESVSTDDGDEDNRWQCAGCRSSTRISEQDVRHISDCPLVAIIAAARAAGIEPEP